MNSQIPGQIFFSHARCDGALVDRVRKVLRCLAPVWDDEHPGMDEEYARRLIVEAIRSSALFVVLLTPNSCRSTWVRWEIHHALRHSPDRLLPMVHGIDLQRQDGVVRELLTTRTPLAIGALSVEVLRARIQNGSSFGMVFR